MPQVLPLSTGPGTPLINAASLGRVITDYATNAALQTALAANTTDPLWPDNLRLTIAAETGTRRFSLSGNHVRNVDLQSGKRIVLAASSNAITSFTGTPTGGNPGDVTVDYAAGVYSTNTAGTWAQTGSILPTNALIDPDIYSLGAGSTNITHALHANRIGSVNQASATTGVFAVAATSGAVAKDSFYLRNSGLGVFTAAGAIVASAGYKLTANKFEAFTADYDWNLDTWVSTSIGTSVVVVAPTVTTQPTSQSVTAGSIATFTAAFSAGNGTLTYQWSKGALQITGATSASFTTPATVLGDSGSTFTCTATNSAGSVTTSAATLTVASAIDTRPGWFAAPSTAASTGTAAFVSGRTALTNGVNGGRTGTANPVTTTGANFCWFAIANSTAPTFRDDSSQFTGGFTLTGATFTDGNGSVWYLYKSDYAASYSSKSITLI